ncbi:MAG: RHS repeat-associated core domain-containing protein, partial [Bacteroidota bacterium]
VHLQHARGRCVWEQGQFHYQYNLTDHLGNVRVVFGDGDHDGRVNPDPVAGLDVVQVVRGYYPFGARHGSDLSTVAPPENQYLYNGKEMQDELDLGWYDYGARMYDPTIGRWNGVDALAEKYTGMSPYNYTLNNPIIFVDPDGRMVSFARNSTSYESIQVRRIAQEEKKKERDEKKVEKSAQIEVKVEEEDLFTDAEVINSQMDLKVTQTINEEGEVKTTVNEVGENPTSNAPNYVSQAILTPLDDEGNFIYKLVITTGEANKESGYAFGVEAEGKKEAGGDAASVKLSGSYSSTTSQVILPGTAVFTYYGNASLDGNGDPKVSLTPSRTNESSLSILNYIDPQGDWWGIDLGFNGNAEHNITAQQVKIE